MKRLKTLHIIKNFQDTVSMTVSNFQDTVSMTLSARTNLKAILNKEVKTSFIYFVEHSRYTNHIYYFIKFVLT